MSQSSDETRPSKRVAVVSGGSRGLGMGIARKLIDQGYTVATFSRSSSPFVEEWRARDPEGATFSWTALDAADRAGIQDFVKKVGQRYGRVDALVNNSAIAPEGILTVQPVHEIEQLLKVNLESAIFLTRACIKVMFAGGTGGSIVNISSVNAIRGSTGVAVYSATKAGLDGFMRSLARELGPQHIRVNSVAPGYFESEMTKGMPEGQKAKLIRRTPLGRLATAADVVSAVTFLLSDDASSITGQTLTVDGGLTC